MSAKTEPTLAPAPAAKPLTGAELLASRPRTIQPIPVPEMGGVVYVRSLTGLELDRLDDALTDEKGKYVADNVRAKVIAMCACDAEGQPLFGFKPEDVTAIGNAPFHGAFDAVYEAAMDLNKRRPADRAEAKKN